MIATVAEKCSSLRHPLFVLLHVRKCLDNPRVAALQHKITCDEAIQISDELSHKFVINRLASWRGYGTMSGGSASGGTP
jgi:hypothetical protein